MILTLVLAVIGAIGLVVPSVLAFINTHELKGRVQEVHILVNSQLAAVMDRVSLLEALLQSKGIDIPEDPTKENPPK